MNISEANSLFTDGKAVKCSMCNNPMQWGDLGVMWHHFSCRESHSDNEFITNLYLCVECAPAVIGGLCRDYNELISNNFKHLPVPIQDRHKDYILGLAKSLAPKIPAPEG